MPRPQKLRNPRSIVAWVEAEIKEEMEQVRGKLSWGEFFTIMWKREKDYISLAVENENLRRENEELKRRIEELMKIVQRLQEKVGELEYAQMSKRDREVIKLRQEIHAILSRHEELRLLDLFRKLGDSSQGEALMKKAEAFIERWFVKNGKYFVSKDLGVVLIPLYDVGKLGWKVRKLEVKT
jgi:predicted RNase H-like nuclease (RuvC/YqgF family)